MSKPNEARLGAFLREVSNWQWSEFVKAEGDMSYTSNQAMIFALVRACAMQNLQAIRLSINRLDGKLATPLKIEYPKIFYLYPNAKPPEVLAKRQELLDNVAQLEQIAYKHGMNPAITSAELRVVLAEEDEPEEDLPSLSIRQTVAKMSDYSRELPQAVAEQATMTEQYMKNGGPKPSEDPMVKSVMAAHLLIMAQNRSIDALGEVFDSIDGKLAETFQVLGEDLYITNYSFTAPDTAYVNDDGVVQMEAIASQDMWAQKLGKGLS
jgi:hypothetical protein